MEHIFTSKTFVFSKINALNLNHLLKIIVIFFFCLLTFKYLDGIKLTLHNGFGWDGLGYYYIMRAFPFMLEHKYISNYDLQHLLPAIIIWAFLNLFHFSYSMKNVWVGALVLNFIFITVSVFIWYKLVKHLDVRLKIFSFCGLFYSYAIVNFSNYYAYLPDVTAFTFGMILMYLYFNKRHTLFIIFSMLSTLIFPSFGLINLLLFSTNPFFNLEENSKTNLQKRRIFLFLVVTLLMVIILCVLNNFLFKYALLDRNSIHLAIKCLYFFANNTTQILDKFGTLNYPADMNSLDFYLLPISIVLLTFYLFYALKPIFKFLPITFKGGISVINWKRLALYLFFIYGFIFLQSFFTFNSGYGAITYFYIISYLTLIVPLISFIMGFIYFGPVILLVAIFWKQIIEFLFLSKNLGLIAVLLMTVLMSLDSESRHLINFIPIVVISLTYTIANRADILEKLTPRFLTFFFLFSVLILNINQVPLLFTHEPFSYYVVSSGPYINDQQYFFYMILTLISFGILRYYFFKKERLKYF